MFIVFPNGFKPQSTLELAEEDMRYIDDQTIRQLAFSSLYLFDKQIVENADKASTLQRVLNADKESSDYNKPIDVPLRTYYRRK